MISTVLTSLVALLPLFLTLSKAHPAPTPQKPKLLVSRDFNDSDIYANWPTFDQLPLDPSYPTKAAWGVWGADDELGALNHITPSTIKAAMAEVQEGIAINMNLRLDSPSPPVVPDRPLLVHNIIARTGHQDDLLVLNTQISTQIDGFRHFPYQDPDANTSSYRFYNDLITFDDLFAPEGIDTIGIQNAAQKVIVGRGVLLDWAGWMDQKNETVDTFSNRTITVDELDECLKWQGMNSSSFRPGDMLILRTGWTRQYNGLSDFEKDTLPYRPAEEASWVGVEASDRSLAWIWDKKISLVGSDNPAFEVVPFTGVIGGVPRSLHQIFLGGWGQHIVEHLDLEKLAETAHTLNRYTFFCSMEALNVAGGVASPPNAIAIF